MLINAIYMGNMFNVMIIKEWLIFIIVIKIKIDIIIEINVLFKMIIINDQDEIKTFQI